MAKKKVEVTPTIACQIINLVDKGLVGGTVGVPLPGQMCVEAVVSFAMREERLSDKPKCVHPYIRGMKIHLNDMYGWADNDDRAAGLRELSIAQLGSAGVFEVKKFRKLLAKEFIRVAGYKPLKPIRVSSYQQAVQAADAFEANEEYGAHVRRTLKHLNTDTIVEFFGEGSSESLHKTCDMIVAVFKKMKLPGTKYLWITKDTKRARAALKKAGVPTRPDLDPNDYEG